MTVGDEFRATGAAAPSPLTLEGARSPFLRHGATQPVRWMPWGEAAFERARRENRPVLLDIGAVWCHWCHVMDHESYEDPETAALINDLFVPVKVDRDELPDVDARYQRAVQALSGQGGWPLTAFLTPDGDAFYGGTYFPPDDRLGRPAFRRVLREVARVWRENPDRAEEAAKQVRERLDAYERSEAQAGEVAVELVDATVEAFAQSFDFRNGGFGLAPKFPNAGAMDLLLTRYLDTGTGWMRRIVAETLDAMARGGIHDQLGGGFHRYATDAKWRIPHFEKMAYDNGVLLETYAIAHGALGDPLYRAVAEGILAHYRDVAPALVDEGGFPASQDADVGPHDDGGYWTWTVDEVRAALDGDETSTRAAVLRYGLDDVDSSMPHDRSRHVPYLARSVAEVAAELGDDEAATTARLAEVRARLKAARDARPRPFVDETVYSGWSALVASGHLAAARYLGRADAADTGIRALDRIWSEAADPASGVVRHRVGNGESGLYLEDQAYMAQALLDAYETVQRPDLLERARRVADGMLSTFRDAEGGALLDRPRGARGAVPGLEAAYRPIMDSPAPGANAVAALTMLRLAALGAGSRYSDAGQAVLEAFAGSVPRFSTSAATYIRAVDWATGPVTTVVVVGDAGEPAADALFEVALRTYRPRSVLRRFAPGQVPAGELPPELRAMLGGAAPRAYLCAGQSCAAPVESAEALAELLREFRG